MRNFSALLVLGAALAGCSNDPVDRELVGTWQTAIASEVGAWQLRFTTLSNGQYRTDFVGPFPVPAETGYFAAEDGEWRIEKITGSVEEGTYEFLSEDSVLFKTPAGAIVWNRVAGDPAAATTFSAPDAADPALQAAVGSPATGGFVAPAATGFPPPAASPDAAGTVSPDIFATGPFGATLPGASSGEAAAFAPSAAPSVDAGGGPFGSALSPAPSAGAAPFGSAFSPPSAAGASPFGSAFSPPSSAGAAPFGAGAPSAFGAPSAANSNPAFSGGVGFAPQGGMPVAPAPFGVPSAPQSSGFGGPGSSTLAGFGEAQPSASTAGGFGSSGNGAGAFGGPRTVGGAVGSVERQLEQDVRQLRNLPQQTVNTLERDMQQTAAQVVNEAAAPVTEAADEATRKAGQRVQQFTSNAASKVRNFFTRGNRKGDEDSQAEQEDR
jgi:hypothetical protein